NIKLRSSSGAVFTVFPTISALGNRAGPNLSFDAIIGESDTRIFKTTLELVVSNDLVSIAQNANDPIVFQKAKQWLVTCATEHFECTKEMEVGDHPHNPTRLLDIGERPYIAPMRLIESPRNLVMYSALSYCWGEEGNALSTTQANIHEHQQGIPLDRFSGTLLDFITAARKLDIRYVWIDALCIIQDDPEDFALYSHAIVTISVCSSKSSSECFLTAREAETLQVEQVVFAGSRLSVKAKTLEEVRAWSPLMERAWTFQEELLSPRVLYWTNHGIFWSCTRKQYAEHDALAALPPRTRITDWTHTIESYASRFLSHQNDRLTALAGVATKFSQANPGDEYLAGLWKSSLPYSILWIVNKGDPSHRRSTESSTRSSQSVEDYVAPSWSWASLKSGIHIHVPTSASGLSNCLVKDHTVTLKGDDHPQGPITFASITLESAIRPLLYAESELISWPRSGLGENKQTMYTSLWEPKHTHALEIEKGQMISSPGRNKWVVVELDRLEELEIEAILCLQIDRGFLAVQRADFAGETSGSPELGDTTVYRRVGAGLLSQCPEFFNGAKRRAITLI
ncbi:hypothetical protein EG329_008776, partial [Mollisiaceae sp. DMI_Dod_QoI]